MRGLLYKDGQKTSVRRDNDIPVKLTALMLGHQRSTSGPTTQGMIAGLPRYDNLSATGTLGSGCCHPLRFLLRFRRIQKFADCRHAFIGVGQQEQVAAARKGLQA